MADDLFDQFMNEVLADLKSQSWDAVYLSLHGSLATVQRPTPELDLLRAVRGVIGKTPLGVSFDMHANLGPEIVETMDIAAGYKTLPHIDMLETAQKVLGYLVDIVKGELRPVGRLVRAGHIIHSFNMRTSDGPMKELQDIAQAACQWPVLDISTYGGFPWADSVNTGASVMAYAHADGAAAEAAATAVSRVRWARSSQVGRAL